MIALLVALTPANAVNMTQTLCWRFAVDFDDDVRFPYEDDYLNDDEAQWFAKSTKLVVKRNPNYAATTYYTDTNGCVSFTAVVGASYSATLHAESNQSGRVYYVKPSATGAVYKVPMSFTAASDLPTRVWIVDGAEPGNEWVQPFLAGSRAIRQNTTGFVPATYRVYLTSPGAPFFASYKPLDDAIFLHPTEWTGGDYPAMRKYVVAHELGHQLQQRLNEANGCPLASPATCTAIDYAPNFSAAADEESCEADWGGPTQFSYSKVSKEYQSLAAVEGFADYVAAVSFNDPNGTDCRIVPVGEVYWNHAGVDTSPSNGPYSCEGESDGDPGREYTTPPTPVEGRDAFGQFCTSNGQTTNNRGTILDWTRFFWDLTSKHDLDLAEVGDIWAATESNTWCSTDSAGSGFGATVCPQVWQHLPRSRFEAAMDSTGSPQAWRNAWDQESDNGVTR